MSDWFWVLPGSLVSNWGNGSVQKSRTPQEEVESRKNDKKWAIRWAVVTIILIVIIVLLFVLGVSPRLDLEKENGIVYGYDLDSSHVYKSFNPKDINFNVNIYDESNYVIIPKSYLSMDKLILIEIDPLTFNYANYLYLDETANKWYTTEIPSDIISQKKIRALFAWGMIISALFAVIFGITSIVYLGSSKEE